MTIGSTLAVFKRELRDALRARPGLANVQIEYSQPETELQDDSIWFETADGSTALPVMRAGTKPVDETYQLKVAVQVLRTQGESQETADDRCIELFAEVQQCVAENPQLIPEIQWAKLEGWNHVVGMLASGGGHGSRFDAQVTVKARLFP